MNRSMLAVIVWVIVAFAMAGAVCAGSLDSPASPSSPASAMYTLDDLYNRLNAGTPGAKRAGAFMEPTSGPASTVRTTDDIMGVAPALDLANGASDAQVLSGKTYWSLMSGSWGVRTGAVPMRVLSADSEIVDAGYYGATSLSAVDADLSAANIKSGVSIFGVMGSAPVPSGNATAAQVLSGRTFSTATGTGLTGSMPNRTGSVNAQSTNLSGTTLRLRPPEGYYSGTTTNFVQATDARFVATNIRSGVSIFGLTGSAPIPSGNATAEQVLSGRTFSTASGTGLSGTMTNHGAQGFMPGSASVSIPAGYYSGSGVVTGSAALVATNIRSGASIFGVAGTAPIPSGNATAAQVLSGRTFSTATDTGLTGSMPNRTGSVTAQSTSRSGTTLRFRPPEGYYSGTATNFVQATDARFVATNIRAGVSVFGLTGSAPIPSGNATAEQVLSGRTFSTAAGTGLTGTMTNHGARGFMPGSASVSIPAGYYSGSGVVTGSAALVATNIRSGASIFGVAGTAPIPSGNATAEQVLSGRTFSTASGTGLTGSMPNRTGSVTAQSTSRSGSTLRFRPPEGYYSGTTTNFVQAVDARFVATNIRSGVSVFGLTGSAPIPSGNATAGQVLSGRTFSTDTATGLTGTMVDRTGAVTAQSTSRSGTTLRFRPQAGYYSGTTTNFVQAADVRFVATNIRSGVSIFGLTGSAPIPSGNATAGQVLSGRTFSTDTATGLTGTMVDRTGAVTAQSTSRSGTTLRFRPQAGYYSGTATNFVQASDAQFVATNIRAGVSVFGLTGSAPIPSGNATADQVLSGRTFSTASGTGLSGTMPNRSGHVTAASNSLSGTTVRFHPQAGYYPGGGANSVQMNVPTLLATNIRGGVNILGVNGQMYRPPMQTRQTTSYRAGDDGALQRGQEWPSGMGGGQWEARINTQYDTTTGLEWPWQPHALSGNSGVMQWNAAVDYCRNLVYDGRSDWRLPNRYELETLLNFAHANSATWLNAQGFSGIQGGSYWTSSTSGNNTNFAFMVTFQTHLVGHSAKTGSTLWVIPVRGP